MFVFRTDLGVEMALALKNDQFAVDLFRKVARLFERDVRIIIGVDKTKLAATLLNLFEVERFSEEVNQIVPSEVVFKRAD